MKALLFTQESLSRSAVEILHRNKKIKDMKRLDKALYLIDTDEIYLHEVLANINLSKQHFHMSRLNEGLIIEYINLLGSSTYYFSVIETKANQSIKTKVVTSKHSNNYLSKGVQEILEKYLERSKITYRGSENISKLLQVYIKRFERVLRD